MEVSKMTEEEYNRTITTIIAEVVNKLDIEEMAAIYQLADIMIYPSIFEGFGIPILEAIFS